MPTHSQGMASPAGPPSAPVPRRRFIEVLLGSGFLATAVAFLYPVLRYLVPPKASDLGSDAVVAGHVGELKPNSGKIFRFGNRPGLLIRTTSGEYRAMSAICTHLSCTVQYRVPLHLHLNGRNISGPPPRPLEAFEVQVQGDAIFVRRRLEG